MGAWIVVTNQRCATRPPAAWPAAVAGAEGLKDGFPSYRGTARGGVERWDETI